jgi:catechol 2,3-dioxygenase-like lactoylglutathione lyase family enzyme
MIQGISHLTFIVRDLDRMDELLTKILDARKVYDSGDKIFSRSKERFFVIGTLWIAIMEGDALPTEIYNHVAFKIDPVDYDDYLSRIKSLGLKTLDERPRIEGEARSIYFYDYDNHLFELHAGTLEKRLSSYEKH